MKKEIRWELNREWNKSPAKEDMYGYESLNILAVKTKSPSPNLPFLSLSWFDSPHHSTQTSITKNFICNLCLSTGTFLVFITTLEVGFLQLRQGKLSHREAGNTWGSQLCYISNKQDFSPGKQLSCSLKYIAWGASFVLYGRDNPTWTIRSPVLQNGYTRRWVLGT